MFCNKNDSHFLTTKKIIFYSSLKKENIYFFYNVNGDISLIFNKEENNFLNEDNFSLQIKVNKMACFFINNYFCTKNESNF